MTFIRVLVLLLLLGPAAAAQHRPASSDTLSRVYLGVWEGPYTSDHAPPGTIRLAVTRDSSWRGTMEISAAMPIPPATLSSFRIDGRGLAWAQELMGMHCAGSATLAESTLTGALQCGHVHLPFTLRKK